MALIPLDEFTGHPPRNESKPKDPYEGMPVIPDYRPGWDPSMAMTPQVEERLSGINYNTEGLDRFRNEALRTGQSPWASMMQGKSRLNELDARENAIRDSRSMMLQAEGDIAGASGLSAGTRERLARSGGQNALDMTQNVARSGTLDRMGISITDEQQRVNQLSALPGLEQMPFDAAMAKENIWGLARSKDISRELTENQNYNQYIMDKYGIEGSIWGAGKTADAMADDDETSFICTALRQHGLMSKAETKAMTRMMLKCIWFRADVANWYFKTGRAAIEEANKNGFDWSTVKKKFVDDILVFDPNDPAQLAAAHTLYVSNAHELFVAFLGHDPTWKDSFLRRGMFKSILAWPELFTSKETLVWLSAYAKRRLKKFWGKVKLSLGGNVCPGL